MNWKIEHKKLHRKIGYAKYAYQKDKDFRQSHQHFCIVFRNDILESVAVVCGSIRG